MILTYELLESGKSERGGFNRKQLEIFGVRWPLKKGWKRKILGKDFTEAQINEFLLRRNEHIVCEVTPFLFATEGL